MKPGDTDKFESLAPYVPCVKQVPLTGFVLWWAHLKHKLNNILTIAISYKSIRKIIRLNKRIQELKAEITTDPGLNKLVKIDGRVFFRIGIPGWEGQHFKKFLLSETNRIEPLPFKTNRLISAFVAVTKKCPLKCEHCFEWDNLNKPEYLSQRQIESIIVNLQHVGTSNILFTGGEPTIRHRELIPLIEKFRKDSAFWMLTSGFNFTEIHAQELKQAGLTGVIVSLDHHLEDKHNKFRGDEHAFHNALMAAKHAIENQLVTVFSICFTRETANTEFIHSYMELAKEMGVAFVQFIEPKPVGHYGGKDVLLLEEHIEILDQEFVKYNKDKAFKHYPIIIYHGNYQRKIGCLMGGSRGIYIDTNGEMVSCPFCHNTFGSAINEDFQDNLIKLTQTGCKTYDLFQL